MADHVLGYLARRFTVSEENLATEALTWILRDQSATTALLSLARSAGTSVPDALTFVGQVGNTETGRPDVVGFDGEGRQRLLIEAKFGAGLTSQQPGGYLKGLPQDVPSMLLVVAPEARQPTLWAELLRAIPEHAKEAPSPSSPLQGKVHSVPIGQNSRLALTSWRYLVELLLDAVRVAGGVSLAQDVEQLLALTEVMDSHAYAPVRPGDYGLNEARRIQQLVALIDGVHGKFRQHDTAEHAGRSSHGRIFYGWYLRSRATGKGLWFGFLPRVWAQRGITPLWAQISPNTTWSRHRVAQALSPLHHPGAVGVFEDNDSFVVPLALAPHLSRDETVADLQRQIEEVFALLDAAVPAGETPVPEVLADPVDDSVGDEAEAS